MKYLRKFWPFLAIGITVLVFFFPVFKGNIPFPGDLLVNQAPYKTESYLGYAPGGYPNKAQGPDVIYEIYPWRNFAINELKQGQIPFWNPYNFSGNPQMANFQTAVFYPFNLFYFILPFNAAWTLIIMLQPFLAGLFMYLFLKKGIGLKDFPSLLGAIGFGFSSYMTVWIEYGNIGSTILWLPLTLLFIKQYFNKASVLNLLGIVLSLSFSILAGYIQGVFYAYIVSFFYYVFLSFSEKNSLKNYKKNLIFLISLIIPFMLTSFQLFPTLDLFSQSTRGAYSLSQIEKNLSPIFYWITGFFPDFFGNPATRNYWLDGTYIERVLYPGTVFIFFALYVLLGKINMLEKKFFVILATVSLVIATNVPFIKFFYLIPIPVISTTVATREFSIFIFSIIVLGSIGVEHFLKEATFNKKFVFAYLLLFGLVWLVVLLASKVNPNLSEHLKVSMHNLILPSVFLISIIFAVFIKKLNKKISMVVLILVLIFDLFYFFQKITPFSPSYLTYPKTPVTNALKQISGIKRVWGYGSAYVPANIQSVDRLFSPEGNDPLHISRYGELLSSSKTGTLPQILPRPDANIAPGYGAGDLKSNFYRKRILDLLGVSLILNEENSESAWYNPDINTFPESDYSMVGRVYPWQIYENLSATPRFFLTGDYVIAKDKIKALSLIYDKNIKLDNTLILEEKPELNINKHSTGSATLVSYTPNEIIIKTDSSGNALLFISDNYYKDWKAAVDGNNEKVLLADYSFRAVSVPEGKHEVVFYYDPNSFYLGLGVGILGILGLSLSLYYVKKIKQI